MADQIHAIAQFNAQSEAETGNIARTLALCLHAGDVVALDGTLGAGKTAFARALINALPGEPEDVPSPTFTLVQTYERGLLEIWHFDLYRLDAPEDAYELGIDDAFADALSIIEWPENLGSLLPPAHLRITLQQAAGDDTRKIAFEGNDDWMARLSNFSHRASHDG